MFAVLLPCLFVTAAHAFSDEGGKLHLGGSVDFKSSDKELVNFWGVVRGFETPSSFKPCESWSKGFSQLDASGAPCVNAVNVKQNQGSNQASQQRSGPSGDFDHFDWWVFIGAMVPILMFIADALITQKPNVELTGAARL